MPPSPPKPKFMFPTRKGTYAQIAMASGLSDFHFIHIIRCKRIEGTHKFIAKALEGN